MAYVEPDVTMLKVIDTSDGVAVGQLDCRRRFKAPDHG
jgi:hypothetical protein